MRSDDSAAPVLVHRRRPHTLASPRLIELSTRDPKLAASILQDYARTAPTTDEELRLYIEIIFGVKLPRWTVTEGAGVVSPLKWIADCFFERIGDSVVMGARASYKTLSLAILHTLNSIHKPKCETVSVAAQLTQPKRCMGYVQGFLRRTIDDCGLHRGYLRDPADVLLFGSPRHGPVVDQMLKERIEFANGSTLYIAASTVKGVSGPHPQKAAADEVEHWTGDGLEQFFGMSTKGDTPWRPQRMYLSTRQTLSGQMNRLVEQHEALGLTLYWWSILDVMESCTKRFGGCLCHPEDEDKFTPEACILWDDCKGRCAKADGSREWEEIVGIKRGVLRETFETQYLCLRPSREGLVYANFNPAYHVTEKAEFDPERLILIAADPAMQVPYAVLLAHETVAGLDIFDELYETQRTTQDMKKFLVTGDWPSRPGTNHEVRTADLQRRKGYFKYLVTVDGVFVENIDLAVIDTRASSEAATWGATQYVIWNDEAPEHLWTRDRKLILPPFPMRTCRNHPIREHVALIKNMLDPTPIGPAIRINPRCVNLIAELQTGYKFKQAVAGMQTDEFSDINNHAVDALGYLVYSKFGSRGRVRLT